MRMIRSKPRMPPPTTRAATTSRATTLVAVPPLQPSWVNTVEVASVASETSTVSQPTVRTPGQHRRDTVSVDPDRRPAEDERRCRAPLPGDRDEPAEQEGDDDADDPGDDGLPERDAEAEEERAVGQAEHAHVGAEPRPEQLARRAPALTVGDDVDAVRLDGHPRRGRLGRAGQIARRLLCHRSPSSCGGPPPRRRPARAPRVAAAH